MVADYLLKLLFGRYRINILTPSLCMNITILQRYSQINFLFLLFLNLLFLIYIKFNALNYFYRTDAKFSY